MFKHFVRVSSITILVAFCFFSVRQVAAETFSIRGLQWGANAESIKTSEKAPLKRETANGAVKYLIYTDTFAGEQVSVVYRLIHDKLFEVTYQFENKGRACKDMTAQFDAVVAELSAKNGQPSSKEPASGNGCNANSAWELGDTNLRAHLSSDSGKVDLAVICTSKEMVKLAEDVTYSPQPAAH